MRYQNIYSRFAGQVERYGDRNAFYVRRGSEWAGITWESFGREAREFACALAARGLKAGGSICILMGNVPEWPVADLGTIIAGGVSVGLYPSSSAEQCQYIINHSDAELVLVDTAAQLDKIMRVREALPKVRTIVALDEAAAQTRAGVAGYSDFLQSGRERREQLEPSLTRRARAAQLDDVVIMVYTSGTTGLPKGARLSHRYVLGSVESLQGVVPLDDADVAFSYLPYCHVAERISGLYTRLSAGATTYFVDDAAKLWDYMTQVRPSIFGSLPRFFEKIHARVPKRRTAVRAPGRNSARCRRPARRLMWMWSEGWCDIPSDCGETDRRVMNLTRLAFFTRVAEEGSFQKAACGVFHTPPAASVGATREALPLLLCHFVLAARLRQVDRQDLTPLLVRPHGETTTLR